MIAETGQIYCTGAAFQTGMETHDMGLAFVIHHVQQTPGWGVPLFLQDRAVAGYISFQIIFLLDLSELHLLQK